MFSFHRGFSSPTFSVEKYKTCSFGKLDILLLKTTEESFNSIFLLSDQTSDSFLCVKISPSPEFVNFERHLQ